ncbi:MAG: hypothetical protein K2P72_15810 [Sphingomonas ursincola]|nr:hypothetical protein [Sphingomonas ursincola]
MNMLVRPPVALRDYSRAGQPINRLSQRRRDDWLAGRMTLAALGISTVPVAH